MLNKFLLNDAYIYLPIYVRFTLFEITKGNVYTVYSAFLCLLHYAFCYQFISFNTVYHSRIQPCNQLPLELLKLVDPNAMIFT